MKSRLTLRMDEDVKERAKETAREWGTSLSALVENHFRLLSSEASSDRSGDSGVALTPRLKDVHKQIGVPPDDAPFDEPRGDLTEDGRRFTEAATEKHA